MKKNLDSEPSESCDNSVMTTKMMQEFAERLQRLCIERFGRINRAEIGRALGVTGQMVQHYLDGESWPRDKKMREIADYFGVSMDYLRIGKGDPKLKAPERPNDELDVHTLTEAFKCVDEAIDFFPSVSPQQRAMMLAAVYKFLLADKSGNPMSWEAAKSMVSVLASQMQPVSHDNTDDTV